MGDAGQLAPLASIFAQVYADLRPRSERVAPAPLVARIAGWLAPGGSCAAVLQLGHGEPAVSPTGFASPQTLPGTMRLVAPEDLRRLFALHGLAELRAWQVPLPGGKAFHVGLFGAPAVSAR